MSFPSISVIVTTYNWPGALERVLNSLCDQQYSKFEIIVADDGSTDATAQVIQKYKSICPFPIIHCWQADEGFRAAMIRNRAVAIAKGDYLIFLDGDCIVRPHFVSLHAAFAEPGWFVSGNRILLNKAFTDLIINNQIAIQRWPLKKWLFKTIIRQCNRFTPFLHLPLGLCRKLFARRWQGVKTCNLAMWRNDYISVNGLDENFTGWGYEDSDLVVRLQRANILRKSGQYALPVLHLWHPNQDRSKAKENKERLLETIRAKYILAQKGVNQYVSCSLDKGIVIIRDWRRYICCQKKYYSHSMENLLLNIEHYLKNPVRVLKNDASSLVVIVNVAGEPWVIKCTKVKDMLQKVRHFVARSRGKKNWLNANKLLNIGINTFTPIAYMEKRLGIFKTGTYFICSYIDGKSALEFFNQKNNIIEEQQRLISQKITKMLMKLSQHWISHRDVNLSNIILVNDEPWLIDLDSMRQHYFSAFARHSAIREYERFMQNWMDALGGGQEMMDLFESLFGELKSVKI